MSSKKKKNSNKPAVGSPAAGSNNKKAKNNLNNPQKGKTKAEGSGKKPIQNNKAKDRQVDKKALEKMSKEKEQQRLNKQKEKEKKQQEDKINSEKRKAEKEQQRLKKQGEKEQKAQLSQKKKEEKASSKSKKSEPKIIHKIKKFTKTYNMGKIAAALGIIIALAVGIIILISSLLYAEDIPDRVKNAQYRGRNESASDSYNIELSSEQQKKLAETVKVKGDKRAFSFFVNEEIVIEDYDDPALLDFGSVSTNDCILIAFIVDENGTVLYNTLGIEPGKGVRSINLFNEVSYGTHDATLVVNGYDKKTYEKIGMQTTDIKIKIGVDSVEK